MSSEYKAEDFLQDQTFLNYCLARDEQDVKKWTEWIKSNPDRENEVREAVELYHLLNGQITAAGLRDDEMDFINSLDNYKNEENTQVVRSPRVKLQWWYAAAAAAVMAGIIFISWPAKNDEKKYVHAYTESSKRGERRSLLLPDGSSVQLNSGSLLTVAEGFNSETRELTLKGEAFFRVKHDPEKPFIIHARNMDVKVLGTVFNVKAYDDEEESEATLLEGSVEVTLTNDNNRKVVLVPNQKISYGTMKTDARAGNDKVYKLRTLKKLNDRNTTEETSWTKNQMLFEDDSFRDIARELERWYDVKILFDQKDIEEYRFTATFEDKTLTEVLEALKLSRQFSYQVDGKAVHIGQ